MSTIIGGSSPSITFSDSTTQASAGLPLTGGTLSGALTVPTLNSPSGVLATQNGMNGIAKAWVNFNGTSGAINGSFNVSSVTYVSTGTYTVNFTTAMANANYVVSLMSSIASNASNGTTNQLLESTTPTTSSFTWNNYKVGTGVFNPLYAHVAVFGA